MANHEINEEQEAVNKALRMIETSDPVHADVYNALFSILINNDVFLEKLANKMVQQVMISHVMDSTNPDMVMGADQGPVITKLIEKVQEQVNVLNTNTQKISENIGGRLEYGSFKLTAKAISEGYFEVSFSKPFTKPPIILVTTGEDTAASGSWMACYLAATRRTTSNFVFKVKNMEDIERIVYAYWLAIGN